MVTSAKSKKHNNEGFSGFPIMISESYYYVLSKELLIEELLRTPPPHNPPARHYGPQSKCRKTRKVW